MIVLKNKVETGNEEETIEVGGTVGIGIDYDKNFYFFTKNGKAQGVLQSAK